MNPVASSGRHDSLLAPGDEARHVIETENKSWEAEPKEPAFLIAVRYAALHRAYALIAACQEHCMHAAPRYH